MRALQQSGEVAVVETAEALQEAVAAGQADIEIRAHLDLTLLDLSNFQILGQIPESVMSIRGNCSDVAPPFTPPTGHAPLRDLLPGQCLLLADDQLMDVMGQLWLDGLYVRLTLSIDGDFNQFLWSSTVSELWMTNVTLQGNGDGQQDCQSCGVLSAGHMYAEGCTFADFDGSRVLGAIYDARVSLVQCTFAGNTLFANDFGAAVIEADGTPGSPQVRLEGCTFSSNIPSTLPILLADHRATVNEAVFYSDSPSPAVCTYEGDDASSTPPPCVDSSPLALEEAGVDFRATTDAWFVEVQQGHQLPSDPPAAVTAAPAPAPTPEASSTASDGQRAPASASSSSKSPSLWEVVAAVLAAVLLCSLAVGCFLLFRKRRASAAKAGGATHAKEVVAGATVNEDVLQNELPRGAPPVAPVATAPNHRLMHAHKGGQQNDCCVPPQVNMCPPPGATGYGLPPSLVPVAAPPVGESSMQGNVGTLHAAVVLEATHGGAVGHAAAVAAARRASRCGYKGLGAPAAAHMEFLQQQLDWIGMDSPILEGLVLLGSGTHQRLQGGQAVVQMARGRHDGVEYAIKFYVSRSAFEAERGLYSQRTFTQATGMAQFLPQVRNVESNADKSIKDPQGNPLPPCIVMERGESLDIWSERARPDRSQAFMMVHHLAMRMREFHALGYVHRDLKPGNVMWLPRENRWTVIDFGCAARTGKQARLGFSLAYAAPEVISAYRAGAHSMVAQEAVDGWSLGVMAFELLVGHPALRMHEGKDKVMDRIEGMHGKHLPWEDACMTATDRKNLGVFRSSLMALLSRDPARRPSMERFCDSCDRVLAGTTTVQV